MIGKKLRTYEITEEIGSGGMATVFRAYQPSMDRHVAIKVIHASILHDPGLRERFQREARLIARLEHPHLLPVYDFDGEHDPPYIVMRYLEGGTLKEVRQRGEVPRDELLYILRQLAGALDYAHRQGVVHRDLKPSNVMIDREGNAFLTDFGIARASGGEKDLTGTGFMVGTPGYMAPEQARGDGVADKAADIYSLGVIAFEALCGSAPYEHENGFEIILAHINNPIPNASERSPDLPKAVDAVLARAIAKERTDRFPTATEFIESLTHALEIKPSDAPTALQSMTQMLSVDQLNKMMKQKAESETPGSGTPSDQQRQMTALSIDVKDLAEILYEKGFDAERARKAMDGLWSALSGVATEHGGTVQSRAEEAGLILWGRDRAREDDSENAIRAALQMRDRVLAQTRKVLGTAWEPTEENPLPFMAGITTGPVLLERETSSGTYMVSGAPITLAGRLREAAPPGGILVAHETFTLVRGVFNFTQHESIRVRGRKDPIEVYLVTQAKARAFRSRAMGIEGVETKMIGREIELRLLQEALTLTLEDGETQVVTVVGEAGIGKSRLLFEFSTWIDLQEQRVWYFEARATQPSMLQPYSLARDLFSFRFRILDSDPLSVVHEKFVKGIAGFLGENSVRKAHLIGQLVGFDFSSKADVEAALKEADAFRREAQEYLGEFFTTASKTSPVMIHIEDIHWADDRSLDIVNNLVRENTDLPLFVLCMSRPSLYERRPQWGEGQRFHERIQLEPLSQLSSRRLVRELLKNVPEVPTALRDLVVDRADGNPFYIEELIKALIDDRVILKGEGTWSVDTTRLSTVRVPATLTGVLQSRLDTLPTPLHQVLQRASVIGRVFWDAAVIHLSRESAGLKPAEVQAMLEELRDREMILQREESGFAGTVEYVFRHAILRDVTYETVIPRQRRALHRLVGDWLLEVGGERSEEQTLLVAEHYHSAEETSLAAEQLLKAANRGVQLATYEEPIVLLARARAMLTKPEQAELRLEVDTLHADIESFRGNYANSAAMFEAALEQASALGSLRLQANLLGKLGRIAWWQRDGATYKRYIEEALELSRKAEDIPALVFNLRQMGNLAVLTDASQAMPYLEESIALARRVGDYQAESAGLNSLGIALTLAEKYDEGLQAYEQAIEINRPRGDRAGIAMVLSNIAALHASRGQVELGEKVAKEGIALAKELGAQGILMSSEFALAENYLRAERNDDARNAIKSAAAIAKRIGVKLTGSVFVHAILKLRQEDRTTGLAWLGFARMDEQEKESMRIALRTYADLIRGNSTEEEVEAAMKAGESLTLEGILAQIEAEG